MSSDNTEGEGYVRYHSNSSRMVVWYEDVIHWTSDEIVVDFQIVIYPSGKIKVNYRNIDGISNDGATIGIINSDGTVGQQVPFDNNFASSENSILFNTYPNWLSLDSEGGILGYSESDDIILSFNMSDYEIGDYSCYLIVSSNTLANISVPITVHLQNSYLLGDVNADGEIDVLDIVRLVSIILNSDANDYELNASDINGDGDVNVMDVVLLVQLILD